MLGEIPAGTHLRAYYKLENVNDSSGNGFTLTNNNTVLFNEGKLSNAADFGSSGTNKGLNRTTTILSADPVDFYFSFIFKLNSTANTSRDHVLFTLTTATGTAYQVRYTISGSNLTIKNATGSSSVVIPVDTNWHLVQYVRASTTLIIDRLYNINSFGSTTGNEGIAIGNGVVALTLQAFAKVDEAIVSEGIYSLSTSVGQSSRTKYFTQLKGRFCI